MDVSVTVYDWLLRAVSMQCRSGPAIPLTRIPWTGKFLLLSSGNMLTVVVGPQFKWPSEYHHFVLLKAYGADNVEGFVQLGGGVLSAERTDDGTAAAHLIFWRNCPCGKYSGQLGDDELAKFGALLGCRVAILEDSPPLRPGRTK